MGEKYIYTIANLTKKYGPRAVLSGHLAGVLPRGQDRRARPQWIGQEHAAADHGRRRTRVRRPGRTDRRFQRRASCRRSLGWIPNSTCSAERAAGRGGQDAACWSGSARSTRQLAEPQEPDRAGATVRRIGRSAGPDRCRKSLGSGPPDRDRHGCHAPATRRMPRSSSLSGGERRRVALCKILLERPDLLLLDEPTNHLDAEAVAWLERHLAEYPGTVVAVTHDRYFLDNVAGWILELDRGQGHSLGRQLLVLARAKAGPAGPGRKGRLRPAEIASARTGVDSHGAAGPTGQEQGPHQGLRGTVRPALRRASGRVRDPDSARDAPGRSGHRGPEFVQGLRRSATDRDV